MRLVGSAVVACLAFALLLGNGAAVGCDIPVYEYTLNYWQRDPYRVYYLHEGVIPPANAAVNKALQKASLSGGGHANLELMSVDVGGLPNVLDERLKAVLSLAGPKRPPYYAIVPPRRPPLYIGGLGARQARDLVQSPAAKRVADLLCHGKQGVLIVLPGPEEGANQRALQVATGAVDAASHKEQDLGLVSLDRASRADQWLVRQLLSVESDLPELKQPMVFGVFGRAHVTEPYVGKGITGENLGELIEFMNGPCTCQIKEANLGMDLLTNADWLAFTDDSAEPVKPDVPGGFISLDDE